VQETGGQGIRKVRVILRGGSNQEHEQFEATTDETGDFKIEGLEPGLYVVQLQRSGYVADRKMDRGRTTIKVVAGQDYMLAAGAITGKIVDADGDPLRDVDVMATVSTGLLRSIFSRTGVLGTSTERALWRCVLVLGRIICHGERIVNPLTCQGRLRLGHFLADRI